jgi:hypothetical protein
MTLPRPVLPCALLSCALLPCALVRGTLAPRALERGTLAPPARGPWPAPPLTPRP